MTDFDKIRKIKISDDIVYFVARDIATILGYKNTRDSILTHVRNCDKINFKGLKLIYPEIVIVLHSQTTLITTKGVISLFTSGRKNNELFLNWLKENYNISYCIIKRLTKEQGYIEVILKSFDGEKILRQYQVNKYFVDLYLPDYKLVIECDEHNHADRDAMYEIDRTNKITEILECKFIRFNPDEKKFDIFKVINNIFKHIRNY
jgi:very-short-patch-repair endonuclease